MANVLFRNAKGRQYLRNRSEIPAFVMDTDIKERIETETDTAV